MYVRHTPRVLSVFISFFNGRSEVQRDELSSNKQVPYFIQEPLLRARTTCSPAHYKTLIWICYWWPEDGQWHNERSHAVKCRHNSAFVTRWRYMFAYLCSDREKKPFYSLFKHARIFVYDLQYFIVVRIFVNEIIRLPRRSKFMAHPHSATLYRCAFIHTYIYRLHTYIHLCNISQNNVYIFKSILLENVTHISQIIGTSNINLWNKHHVFLIKYS